MGSVEGALQKEIITILQMGKITAWRSNNMGVYDAKRGIYRTPGFGFRHGVSDVLGVLPDGKFLAIEVKSPRGTLSKYQKDFLEEVKKNNGIAIVARSIEDVISGLGKYLKIKICPQ